MPFSPDYCEKLADKIRSRHKLTNQEIDYICHLLSVPHQKKKRGRPSETTRDRQLAIERSHFEQEIINHSIDDADNEVCEFNISELDTYLKEIYEFSTLKAKAQTYRKALQRGLKLLEEEGYFADK